MFGILLGESLLAHTDNLSAALQKKDLSTVAGQGLANQAMETLKRTRGEILIICFMILCLRKKNHFQRFLNLHLKGKSKHPHDIFFGKVPAEHPLTSRDHYQKIYFEAVDLLVGHIEDRFQQPSFQIYQRLESLLLDSLSKENPGSC